MDLNLKGRTMLITGASRGIGESIAKTMAQEGCDLILTATDTAKLGQLATELQRANGIKVETHGFDLSKHDNVKALADVAGDCDILVNNAGAIPRGSLQEVTPEAWRHGWDLKVFGYIDLTRLILPRMTARKSGVIINIVGMAGERPEPKYIATCCGNAALIMFTQCIGGESMRDGVRVVAINPGPIMSDRHRRCREGRRARTRQQGPLAGALPALPDRPARPCRGGGRHGGVPRLRPRLLHQRRDHPHRRRPESPRSGVLTAHQKAGGIAYSAATPGGIT
jgi:hypothetical protein